MPPQTTSADPGQPRSLLSFEYLGLLGIALLVFSNVAVFYDLYGHLASLGISGGTRGFLIGVFSLTTVPLFFFAAPFIDHRNAPYLMLLGIAVMAGSGLAYLWVQSFWGLLTLRVINGVGLFCMSASCMALLVWVLPEGKSGQGFALYSSAILLPYALVPLVVDALAPWLPTRAHAYAGMPILLLPAVGVVLVVVRRRRRDRGGGPKAKANLPSMREMRKNLARLPIAVMIMANAVYFMNFAGLFFMFKGYAQQVDLGNVGKFFTVQMLIMLAIRTFGSGIFDRVSKVALLCAAFFLAGCGHLALALLEGAYWIVPIAVIFGVGLALGFPSLNSLMYLHSEPRYRAMNANLMMMALQAGYFLGPMVGALVVAWGGYHAFFLVWVGLNLAGLISCVLVLRTPPVVVLKK
ncbi:MAG: MFS transporter [Desulfarculaceae bacterium]|nr:MFS transporter [Desulfarculaceae bacterium]MCF8074146.1 MFS transporter [Desulfarculaceae bacterium]MCF8103262.1 MFS transporter [Desulfarculaceae bacterium]MCF8116880.1 MFS transporter [Desulfarculaceae bacterium]